MVVGTDVKIQSGIERELQPSIEADYEACRRIMHAASRNYTFASRFIPAERRKHVEALYAFLRVADDFVDVSSEGYASPSVAIDQWERLYWNVFERGDSPDPVMRAYHRTARRFDIPAATMVPFFRAMRADLSVTRFRTFSDLLEYMDGSAVPVGRAMTHILGVRAGHSLVEALPHADSLSIAMQLSNFLRDVQEDWERGRIYLPLEDLDRFRVTESDLGRMKLTPQMRSLMRFQVERAQAYYRHARPGVSMLAGGRWGVMSGLLVYRGILSRLVRLNYDPFRERASASRLDKARLVAQAWLFSH